MRTHRPLAFRWRSLMSAFIISVCLPPATSRPPRPLNAPATPAATTATPTAVAAPVEPKMICKYENAAGSRLLKRKGCGPASDAGADQHTKLLRERNRKGDARLAPTSGYGN